MSISNDMCARNCHVIIYVPNAFKVSLYNTLLQEIKAKLIGLEKGIKGLTVITSDQEEMYKCIAEGNVPEQWIKGKLYTC